VVFGYEENSSCINLNKNNSIKTATQQDRCKGVQVALILIRLKSSDKKPQMSCPVESDLNRHLEQLDIQAREEKYAEENPSYYWFITTNKWDEHAYSEDEKDELIADAKKEGLIWSCTKHTVGLNY
tara:strand:+ start:31 stop:408 length:378 start_codon:yes stop_codon:yes gene_type:complete